MLSAKVKTHKLNLIGDILTLRINDAGFYAITYFVVVVVGRCSVVILMIDEIADYARQIVRRQLKCSFIVGQSLGVLA
jgi:hypothetical protein